MIRIRARIKNGKLVLSEPISLKEGTEIDIIAYVERDDGEKLDKQVSVIDIDSENINESNIINIQEIKNLKQRKSKEISEEENIQSKIRKLLNEVELSALIALIQDEHPQLLAIIIGMLNKEKAQLFLENVDPDLQGELIYRIALQQKVSTTVLNQIYNVLNRKPSLSTKEIGTQSGGLDSAVEILNTLNKKTETNIINYIEKLNNKFCDKIKKKLFAFEDIIILSDKDITILLEHIELKKLAMALKGAEKELQKKIFKNVKNEKKAKKLSELIKNQDAVRLKDVELIQQEIINVIRKLEENEEITIRTK